VLNIVNVKRDRVTLCFTNYQEYIIVTL